MFMVDNIWLTTSDTYGCAPLQKSSLPCSPIDGVPLSVLAWYARGQDLAGHITLVCADPGSCITVGVWIFFINVFHVPMTIRGWPDSEYTWVQDPCPFIWVLKDKTYRQGSFIFLDGWSQTSSSLGKQGLWGREGANMGLSYFQPKIA